jgi:hypothetical protein
MVPDVVSFSVVPRAKSSNALPKSVDPTLSSYAAFAPSSQTVKTRSSATILLSLRATSTNGAVQ